VGVDTVTLGTQDVEVESSPLGGHEGGKGSEHLGHAIKNEGMLCYVGKLHGVEIHVKSQICRTPALGK
jgi:hypothetical protein